ncbi:DUF6934 family protein [Dyadobacter sp. CY356]|uniref:DUF6934 family protein n=1 Tax=Dyadobacter sp. CY356 TaxID=2906442 RepID=UPI001F35DA19|nr:hypothetical protein [Dyadobacter sp. CY356]MCF0054429.1 hypothetical protein [Dyadobacter sp. CY356]
MKYPRYEYQTENELHFFEFTSKGNKGNIRKIVQYTKIGDENIYNLAFGDYDNKTKEINDKIVTNNGDGRKVLATVVSTLYAFTEKYPTKWVFATGSNSVRTRLYRMGITNNLTELKKDFYVYGILVDETFEEYLIDKNYIGFLVKRKNH